MMEARSMVAAWPTWAVPFEMDGLDEPHPVVRRATAIRNGAIRARDIHPTLLETLECRKAHPCRGDTRGEGAVPRGRRPGREERRLPSVPSSPRRALLCRTAPAAGS